MDLFPLSLALLTISVAVTVAQQAMEERRKYPGWRPVAGVVTSSTRVEEPRRGDTGFYIDTGIELRFSYEVGGIRYEGIYRPRVEAGGRRISAAILRFYPAGSPIKLHYHPSRPDMAEFVPRDFSLRTQVIAVGVLALLTIWAYRAGS